MTEYVILRQEIDEETKVQSWRILAPHIEASSARRAALKGAGAVAGTYAAVPARSWLPLPVKVEQTTKVTIG